MGIKLGEVFPNLECDTTNGKLQLHHYWGDGAFIACSISARRKKRVWSRSITRVVLDTSEPTGGVDFSDLCNKVSIRNSFVPEKRWGILFSHPADFTPVCTTELGTVASLIPEFTKRNVKCIALSCDPVESHHGWIKDIQAYSNLSPDNFPYPIISDPKRDIAIQLGMLDPAEKDKAGLPLTARAVFIVGPDKKLRLSLLYPATTGRNFNEILRVIDSLQLTAYKKVATPADWKSGGECMVLPTVSKDDATKLFPQHVVKDVPSGKEYIRITPQP